jgi:hypothetical protein
MKTPEFQKSEKYVQDLTLECLVATLPNSDIPKLASHHISISGENPEFNIFLRSAKPNTISNWQKAILERLFEKGELTLAIEQGMKEYAADRSSPMYDDYALLCERVRKKEILPHVILTSVTVDEMLSEVILSLEIEWEGNLAEHGTVISLTNGEWKFNYGDYLSDYCTTIESARRKNIFDKIQSKSGVQSGQTRHDTEFIYGVWEFDETAARTLLGKMKLSKEEIEGEAESYKYYRFDISKTYLKVRTTWWSTYKFEFIGCEIKAEKVTLKYKEDIEIISREFVYRNGLLQDEQGLFLRKKKPFWAKWWKGIFTQRVCS